MNFDDPILVKKYGTWLKVQVAFYDFLFMSASNLCATHFNEKLGTKNFSDGAAFYEETMKAIPQMFKTSAEAWNEFCKL